VYRESTPSMLPPAQVVRGPAIVNHRTRRIAIT
jgi:hypothetical protein